MNGVTILFVYAVIMILAAGSDYDRCEWNSCKMAYRCSS